MYKQPFQFGGSFLNLPGTVVIPFNSAGSLDSRISFTRGSVANDFDATPALTQLAINVARANTNQDHTFPAGAPLGFLIEGASTNSMRTNTYTDATNGAIAAAGSELIPDGLFVSDMGSFTNESTLTGTAVWSNSGGVGHLAISGGLSGVGIAQRAFNVVAGDILTLFFTSETNAFTNILLGTTPGGSEVFSTNPGTGGRCLHYTAPSTTTLYLRFRQTGNVTSNLYVVSTRQQALPKPIRGTASASVVTIASRSLFTITAVAAVNGIPTYDIRFQIPVAGGATVGNALNLPMETTTQIAASTGQSWTLTNYVAMVAGSIANLTLVANQIVETTAAGATVLSDVSADFSSSLSSVLAKKSYSVVLSGGVTVAFMQPRLRVVAASAIVDITLRVGASQPEQLPFATSPIITTTAAVARSKDVPVISTLSSIGFNSATGTLLVYAMFEGVGTANTPRVFSFNDGTLNNEIAIVVDDSAADMITFRVATGGVQQAFVSSTVAAVAGTLYKIAVSWATGSFRIAVNGVAGTEDPSGTIPTVTQGNLGIDGAGNNSQNGWIQQAYYNPAQFTQGLMNSITT